MGYDGMDHGGWVVDHLTGFWSAIESKRRKLTAKEERDAAACKGWAGAPKTLNAFHHRAFNLIGIAAGGVYNAPVQWDSMQWDSRFLIFGWDRGDLSTFDFNTLTTLVFLAHDAAIRVSIGPLTPRALQICLHERSPIGEGISRRHPTLFDATTSHMKRFPPDHAIHHPDALAHRERQVAIAEAKLT